MRRSTSYHRSISQRLAETDIAIIQLVSLIGGILGAGLILMSIHAFYRHGVAVPDTAWTIILVAAGSLCLLTAAPFALEWALRQLISSPARLVDEDIVLRRYLQTTNP